jgi:hypothetical protein
MDKFTLVKSEWLAHRVRLKDQIDRIGELANDKDFYTNIDKACSNEWAFLFLSPNGFLILRPRHNQQVSYIDVVAAHCHEGDAISKYLPFVLTLAKKGQAQYLRFYTVRKGFNKVALNHGFTKVGFHHKFAVWRYKI